MKTFASVFLILALIIVACSHSYFVNTESRTNYPDGRDLYISKCNGCHQLYDPNRYTEPSWDSIMVTMKMKAKLNDEQSDEIHKWVLETTNNNNTSMNNE